MKQTRNTVARTQILKIIQSSETALSQSAIQFVLNGLCDRVTTYRVLDRLCEEGLIHKIANTSGAVCYASCNGCNHVHKHDHLHFSCVNCSEITCLEQVVPAFSLPEGFSQIETFFTISGTCNKCENRL